jgi:O-antigen/teichoic acid export membrane protein
MKNFVTIIKRLWNHFQSDSLFQNSVYLMLATAVMASLGFFFWLLNARLFTPEQVGIATTLISVATLISGLSQLGLGNSLIKYLPTSERKHEKINTALTLIIIASSMISLLFLIFLAKLSPPLLFIRDSVIYCVLFIVLTTFSALNMVSDNIFIAYRISVFVFLKNTIFSLLKLILPFFLISFAAYGIYISFGIASAVAFTLSLYFLFVKTQYYFRFRINREIVIKMTKFSLGNYASTFIGNLPTLLLPLLITNSMGTKFSAYFYMDIMIANLLFVIPTAVAQSLFAEGSHDMSKIDFYLTRSLKLVFLVITPAILLIVFGGKYILLAFGSQYSGEGERLLQILALSGLFVSISLVGETLLKLKHQVKKLIFINILYAVISLGLSYYLISYGLTGVGFALMSGGATISIVYLLIWKRI